jgi:hypothetical protein
MAPVPSLNLGLPHASTGAVIKQKNITLFGAASLPWACRTVEYGASVRVFLRLVPAGGCWCGVEPGVLTPAWAQADLLGVKSNVPVTIKPNDLSKGEKLTTMLNLIHDQTRFPARGHFLVTTLWPTNCVIHPGQQ